VIWLEVDARIRHEEKALDLDEGQNLLHVELPLELGLLADVFQPTFVEFYFLVRHDSSDGISLRCIVQTFGHSAKDLLDFIIFIVELVACRDVGREQELQRLMEVVDVPKSDVNIQSVLLGALIRGEHVGLIWLGCRLVARDLDQFCHFDQHREVSIASRKERFLDEMLEEVLGHRCAWLVHQLDDKGARPEVHPRLVALCRVHFILKVILPNISLELFDVRLALLKEEQVEFFDMALRCYHVGVLVDRSLTPSLI